MKKIRNMHILVYTTSLILLLIGFASVMMYTHTQSTILRTYEFTKENLNTPQDGLSVDVSVSKQWIDDTLHPDNQVGAQYDGVLTNGSRYLFKDWKTKLTFSDRVMIDSSWNGDFYSSASTVQFIAKDVPAHAKAKDITTFGAIMYSTSIVKLESCVLSGYRVVKMTDVPFFWALVALSVLWIIFVIGRIVFSVKTRYYRKKGNLDAQIIAQSINTFTGFIDAKDRYTKGHSARVAMYAAEIARRMKLSNNDITNLYYITLMHDCGKIGIPDSILKKPDKLTDEEYKIIQSHTTLGNDILVNFTAIPGIREGAHYHHERYDGKGYPCGLKGKEIPLFARIIGVADAFDAMSTDRCYKKHLKRMEIIKELSDNAGKQFDPDIVSYMIDMINDGFTFNILKNCTNNSDVS